MYIYIYVSSYRVLSLPMAPHSWPAASRICRLTALPEPSSNGGSASGWTTECLGKPWENHGKTMEKS